MIPRLFDPDQDPAPGEHDTLTVASVIGEYLAAKEAQAHAGMIQPEALAKARFYCLAFKADFGTLAIGSCRRGDLKRFLALHPEYRSAWTKHDAAGHVVCAFRWAEDNGLIPSCPYRRPKDLPAAEPREWMRRDEYLAIIEHAKRWGKRPTRKRFRLALRFLWLTGARTCELYRLKWEQYDDDRGVFEQKGKTTHRTGKARMIVLTPRSWRFIRLLRRFDKRPTGHVFLHGRGRPWNRDSFGKLFRKHANRAGVRKEVSAYSARHGFCVELLDAGAGERQVADLMGQETTRQIRHYGRGVRSKLDYLRRTASLRERRENPST